MSILPRRMTFQLTPLLDLLLIVIFAQYMEVQQTSRQTEETLQQRAEIAVAEVKEEWERHTEEWNERFLDEQAFRQELRNENLTLATALERALEQQAHVGDLIAELFQVPEELVAQTMKPGGAVADSRSPEEMERLKESFRDLAAQRGREVVRHLLTYQELQKRCDIWQLYITESGSTIFSTGSNTFDFRVDTAAEFERQLFERYKALPQPKSLVIILFSYGDAKFSARRVALDGLPAAMDRMRADSLGRTRFEYANLGYYPEGQPQPAR